MTHLPDLFRRAGGQLRRPVVWLLGGMAAVGGELFNALLSTLPMPSTLPSGGDTALRQEQLLRATQQFFEVILEQTGLVVAYLFTAVGGLLLLWFLSVFAHGGLMAAVAYGHESLATNLRTAAHWLWRLILLDTALLFPPFVLALLTLLVLSGGMIRIATQEAGVTAEQLVQIILLTLGCMTLLLCCLVPVGLFITLLRHLALRAATLGQMTTRASLAWAWHTLRHHLVAVLLAAVALLLVGMATSVVLAPLGWLETAVPWLFWPAAAVRWLASAAVAGFSSAVWTLLFLSMKDEG